MRVLIVALSCCCLLAGAPRALGAESAPASPSTTDPSNTTVPVTDPAPSPTPTTSPPTTTTPPVSTPTPTTPPVSPPTGAPADSVAAPSAAAQASARSAFLQLTDAQRALLRRLQSSRDDLATARIEALAAGESAARASQRLVLAEAAAERAQTDAAAAERTVARLRVEIQELAGAVYQHLDRTAALSAVDTAGTIELGRAREYSLAPSDQLLAKVAAAKAAARTMATARDEAARQSHDAAQLADAADIALARQRSALAAAERADADAVDAVVAALGSGATLLSQVADPHFGADFATEALAIAQAGQDDPAFVYGMLRSPVPGAGLGSPYGVRVDPMTGAVSYHPGIDLEAAGGEAIHAAAAGSVVIAGDCGGYGNCVVIDHGHSVATLYAHQSKLLVAVGDRVIDGQVVGMVGSTGKSTGPHLHFEVRFHGVPVDPVPMLST